jgi:hypothetical protein
MLLQVENNLPALSKAPPPVLITVQYEELEAGSERDSCIWRMQTGRSGPWKKVRGKLAVIKGADWGS